MEQSIDSRAIAMIAEVRPYVQRSLERLRRKVAGARQYRPDIDRQYIAEREQLLERIDAILDASRSPVEPGARIQIPTDTMEQEFQSHYRRGFEAGKLARETRASFIKADRGYEIEVLRAVQDVRISVGKACELLRDYIATGKKVDLPEWHPETTRDGQS